MLSFTLAKKQLPPLTDLAKVIFHCQAEKKYTMAQIWDLCMTEGMGMTTPMLEFIGRITAGDKTMAVLTENQKKS